MAELGGQARGMMLGLAIGDALGGRHRAAG